MTAGSPLNLRRTWMCLLFLAGLIYGCRPANYISSSSWRSVTNKNFHIVSVKKRVVRTTTWIDVSEAYNHVKISFPKDEPATMINTLTGEKKKSNWYLGTVNYMEFIPKNERQWHERPFEPSYGNDVHFLNLELFFGDSLSTKDLKIWVKNMSGRKVHLETKVGEEWYRFKLDVLRKTS